MLRRAVLTAAPALALTGACVGWPTDRSRRFVNDGAMSKPASHALFASIAASLALGASVALTAVVTLCMGGCSAHDTAEASVVQPDIPVPPAPGPQAQPSQSKPKPDRSGLTRVGVASFYADWFAGRQMADGTPMDPGGANAASRTLPIGTTAKVTNIATGRSAVVTIQDRGPYAKGRLVDLSPATAEKIGITRQKGVARVSVSPIAVPLPDGSVKPGAAAHDPEVPQLR